MSCPNRGEVFFWSFRRGQSNVSWMCVTLWTSNVSRLGGCQDQAMTLDNYPNLFEKEVMIVVGGDATHSGTAELTKTDRLNNHGFLQKSAIGQ